MSDRRPKERLEAAHDHLLGSLRSYMLAPSVNHAAMDFEPFGCPIDDRLDPLRMDAAPFVLRLLELDRRCFPGDAALPAWVLFDCALLPAGVFGYALPASALSPAELRALGADDAQGDDLVPLSHYMAIPRPEVGAWMAQGLASAGPLLRSAPSKTGEPRPLRGLGRLTKVMALKAFGVETLFGACQWENPAAIAVHSAFGPLEVHTAYTPAHTKAFSLTYRVQVDDGALLRAARASDTTARRAPKGRPRMLDPRDHPAIIELQAAIESGSRPWLIGPPDPRSGRLPLMIEDC